MINLAIMARTKVRLARKKHELNCGFGVVPDFFSEIVKNLKFKACQKSNKIGLFGLITGKTGSG